MEYAQSLQSPSFKSAAERFSSEQQSTVSSSCTDSHGGEPPHPADGGGSCSRTTGQCRRRSLTPKFSTTTSQSAERAGPRGVLADDESGRSGSAASRAEDDLHGWLSAALGNQDTCVEGFHGTDGRLLRRIEAAVAQLVSNLLAMHKRLRSITPLHREPPNKSNGTSGGDELPPWAMDIEVDDGDKDEEELVAKRAHAGRDQGVVDVRGRRGGAGRQQAPPHRQRGSGTGAQAQQKEVRDLREARGVPREHGAVSGAGFITWDLTFRDTTGLAAHQVVVLRVDSDRSALFRVAVEGHQDTLYAQDRREGDEMSRATSYLT